jgi:hypothetical protein
MARLELGWFVVTFPDRTSLLSGTVFPFPSAAAAHRFATTARRVTPEVYVCQAVAGPLVPETPPEDAPGCYHQYGWCRGQPVGGSWTSPDDHRVPEPRP